jgi:hypothetical protein
MLGLARPALKGWASYDYIRNIARWLRPRDQRG